MRLGLTLRYLPAALPKYFCWNKSFPACEQKQVQHNTSLMSHTALLNWQHTSLSTLATAISCSTVACSLSSRDRDTYASAAWWSTKLISSISNMTAWVWGNKKVNRFRGNSWTLQVLASFPGLSSQLQFYPHSHTFFLVIAPFPGQLCSQGRSGNEDRRNLSEHHWP